MIASFARLVAFESRRLARSPLLLASIAFSLVTVVILEVLVPTAYRDWASQRTDALPTWGGVVDDAIATAKYIAAGMFFAAFPPALREARHGHSVVAPLDRRTRIVALLAAALLVGGAAGTVSFTVLLVPRGPVAVAGGISTTAFVVPVVLPMVGGALGVLAGVWTRSWIAMIAAALATVAYGAARFITVPVVDQFYGLPDVLVQPADPYEPGRWGMAPTHLAYLLLALGACATVALLRHRRGRRDTIAIATAAAICVAGSAVTFAGQYGYGVLLGIDIRKWADWSAPDADMVCQTPSAITYCAYEGYGHWVPYWRQAVEPVARAVPESEHDRLPTVRQVTFDVPLRLDSGGWIAQGIADPGSVWYDRPEARVDLADQVALVALGAPEYRAYSCKFAGQARLPLYLWMTTYGIEGYRDLVYPTYEDQTAIDPADIALAVAMSETPDDEVIAALHRHWDRLVSPQTTTAQAAGLLGIEVTPAHLESAEAMLAPYIGTAVPVDAFASMEDDPVSRMRATPHCR
ncbi:hypothetical protein ACFOVU_17710 [Nocardiopsis sediminis]|uniref:ABC transporter permease n=1 Tax=Nocardiopsis sediminis TaxID=1778267 RepID=A0ABV8FNY4_9ACTN